MITDKSGFCRAIILKFLIDLKGFILNFAYILQNFVFHLQVWNKVLVENQVLQGHCFAARGFVRSGNFFYINFICVLPYLYPSSILPYAPQLHWFSTYLLKLPLQPQNQIDFLLDLKTIFFYIYISCGSLLPSLIHATCKKRIHNFPCRQRFTFKL